MALARPPPPTSLVDLNTNPDPSYGHVSLSGRQALSVCWCAARTHLHGVTVNICAVHVAMQNIMRCAGIHSGRVACTTTKHTQCSTQTALHRPSAGLQLANLFSARTAAAVHASIRCCADQTSVVGHAGPGSANKMSHTRQLETALEAGCTHVTTHLGRPCLCLILIVCFCAVTASQRLL